MEVLISVCRPANNSKRIGNPTALISYALSELTRRHVKVVLAGEGSDELFAGYLRFRGLVALARASSV